MINVVAKKITRTMIIIKQWKWKRLIQWQPQWLQKDDSQNDDSRNNYNKNDNDNDNDNENDNDNDYLLWGSGHDRSDSHKESGGALNISHFHY